MAFKKIRHRSKEELRKAISDFWFFIKQTWRDFQRISRIDLNWFITWIVIYTSFIFLDIFFPGFWGSNLLKYMGIFLCIVYAHNKFPKDVALTMALFFTLLSDTILVWTPYEWLGVFVFCFAQFMHAVRLTKAEGKVAAYYALAIVFLYTLARIRGVSALYTIAIFYGVELICNVLIAIRNYRKNKTSFPVRCAYYGFLAFLGCDFCVALRHLMLDGLVPAKFLPLVAFLVWVFYYPSQVLIANSSNLQPKKRAKIAKNTPIE